MHDPVLVAVATFGIALFLMCLGLWVALSLALAGILGFYLFRGSALIAGNVFFDATNTFTLTAVPLFIFLGEILLRCGASETIYRGTSRLLGWVPGGLLHANTVSCALFAAISGSSPATAATIGTVAIPALAKRGYDRRLTLGSLAAGGTLGILIPPSINLIIYGMIAEASVGQLFMGGVVPGLLLVLLFMIYTAIRATLDPTLAPREPPPDPRTALLGLVDLWPAGFLGVVVLGGIFIGLVTPTEAAGLGAFGALLIAAGLGRLSWAMLRTALTGALVVSCMVLFVYVGAMVLASFFGVMGVPRTLARRVVDAELGAYQVLLAIFALYLVLGCFLDGISMMVLTVPTVLPIVEAAGFDRIWFGVVLVVLCEIGMITPPMGLNLYVIQGIAERPLAEVVRGVVPFFFLMLLCLALLTLFPPLVLWLPSLMRR
jgi:C4-dicarboxylate transporter, DctM subunit